MFIVLCMNLLSYFCNYLSLDFHAYTSGPKAVSKCYSHIATNVQVYSILYKTACMTNYRTNPGGLKFNPLF